MAAKKSEKNKSGPSIVVEQYGSPIRRPAEQRQTLIGLGLNRIRRRNTLPDNPAFRGMVARVAHMVRIVEEVKG